MTRESSIKFIRYLAYVHCCFHFHIYTDTLHIYGNCRVSICLPPWRLVTRRGIALNLITRIADERRNAICLRRACL